MRHVILPVILCAALAGCGGGTGGGGPDEFSVIPQNPLIIPATNALPAPRPGGTNPADLDPQELAIRAMGGRP
ncbi:Protein of unknown function [Loktanella sp. DSM 29012]|uniref:DUF3035 domain-containing protein n=1 Tax=Loktanella gaetbuli TaxID=2881335 RepID=A0ABS8BUJ8_9RHOB|nr:MULTISPECIES: DUF3035 domain-containing protein [Loktanella]MCB5199390.1 DUF3035 domain-containing protein [Loktanella gaetbuli]SEP56268.1 Protein of unknown function [Loktanella sp. DSM 29012]